MIKPLQHHSLQVDNDTTLGHSSRAADDEGRTGFNRAQITMKSGEEDDTGISKNVVPLRTILRNFINLVENCENRRNGEADLYEHEFQELKQFSESLKTDSFYDSKEGERSVNRKKNRYKDILPFDYSRVTISDYGEIPGSDYVNANFIKGASGSSAYIACQGPLPHTVNDFWRMVVECEVQVIVMACMEQESGKHKCENYWVEENGVEREFGQVTVWLQKCRNVCPDFLVRTMRIRFPNSNGEMEERNVCQFHYSAWPDHGVPAKVRPLLDMVRLIRDCQASETLPVLVHCSAGCGRTGTICAIDYVWGLLRLGKLTQDFSLFHLVREMRRQRIAMVQTKDQYILVHRAVKELFNEQLRIIDAHPYANVDPNGLPLEIKHSPDEPTYATIDVEAKSRSRIPTPAPSPPKVAGDGSFEPPRFKTSLKLPNKIKQEKDLDINQKEDEKVRSFGSMRMKQDPRGSETSQKNSKRDEDLIQPCNGNGEDTVDCSHFQVTTTKVTGPSTSPNRGVSILRKPSIVKLKALFEKSPPKGDKDRPKKANVTPTGLSRAKSDVTASSRFYSFASSFSGSKGTKDWTAGIPKESLAPKPERGGRGEGIEVKKEFKPPLLAKPALPIKRSKSLKNHPEAGPAGKSSGTGNENPIKVCVKHSEIPTLQSVAMLTESSGLGDYEILKSDSRTGSRRESLEPLIPYAPAGSSGSTRTTSIDYTSISSNSIKPPLPAKTYTNIEIQRSNWDQISKDREEVKVVCSLSAELKHSKYDGGTPKSALLVGSLMTNGGLTRSQSHVWQPPIEHPSLVARIFSNENVNKSEAEKTTQIEMLKREHGSVKERILGGRGALDKNGAGGGGTSRVTLSPILGYPMARRRMPKVAAYSNYPIDSDLVVGNSKGIPPYGPNKTFHAGTTGETSSSSSSLPSTPTQSIDRRNHPDSAQAGNIQPPPPKSILKGSLSSTPSESDERLDGPPRPKLGPTLSNTSVVTISNQNPPLTTVGKLISNTRLPIGVRERRNSFRQAVWKEAQNDGQEYYGEPSQVGSSGPAGAHPTNGANGVTEEPLLSAHRIHKDYEPIWPPPENTHVQLENRSSVVNGIPTVKNRIDDFKSLLDELRTPMTPTVGGTGSSSKEPAGPVKGQKPAKSPNLKYHRSLKATSRSEYEQIHHHAGGGGGMSTLSCFRKPTSLESISDQLQSEDCGGKKSAFSFLTREGQGHGHSSGGVQNRMGMTTTGTPSHGFHSGRYANDYVTLEQCRTDPSSGFVVQGEDEVDMPGSSRRHHHYGTTNGNGESPIPPPRTKGKRTHHNSEGTGNNSGRGNTLNGNFLPHSDSSAVGLMGTERKRNNSGDSANANSPIAMTRARAIGIFQDMKSKLTHWSEPMGKERTQSQSSNSSGGNHSKRGSGQSNGSSSSGSREHPGLSRGDRNGVSIPGSSTSMRSNPAPTSSSSRSTSKHQYL